MKWADKALAKRVYEALGHDVLQRTGRKTYYMMNANHPVLRRAIAKYKQEKGLPMQHALGDIDRTIVELTLLAPAALRVVMDLCEGRENQK